VRLCNSSLLPRVGEVFSICEIDTVDVAAVGGEEITEVANSSSLTIVVCQQGLVAAQDRHELLPGQGMLYSWAEPFIVPPSAGGRSWTTRKLPGSDIAFWGSTSIKHVSLKAVVQLPATFLQSAMTSRVLRTVEVTLGEFRTDRISHQTIAIGGVSQQILHISIAPSPAGRLRISVEDAGCEGDTPMSREIQWLQPVHPVKETLPQPQVFSAYFGKHEFCFRFGIEKANLRLCQPSITTEVQLLLNGLRTEIKTRKRVKRDDNIMHLSTADTPRDWHFNAALGRVFCNALQENKRALSFSSAGQSDLLNLGLNLSILPSGIVHFEELAVVFGSALLDVDAGVLMGCLLNSSQAVAFSWSQFQRALFEHQMIQPGTMSEYWLFRHLPVSLFLSCFIDRSYWRLAVKYLCKWRKVPEQSMPSHQLPTFVFENLSISSAQVCINLVNSGALLSSTLYASPFLPDCSNMLISSMPVTKTFVFATKSSLRDVGMAFWREASPSFGAICRASLGLSWKILPSVPQAAAHQPKVCQLEDIMLLPVRFGYVAVLAGICVPSRCLEIPASLLVAILQASSYEQYKCDAYFSYTSRTDAIRKQTNKVLIWLAQQLNIPLKAVTAKLASIDLRYRSAIVASRL
jgi:hypothetical protein